MVRVLEHSFSYSLLRCFIRRRLYLQKDRARHESVCVVPICLFVPRSENRRLRQASKKCCCSNIYTLRPAMLHWFLQSTVEACNFKLTIFQKHAVSLEIDLARLRLLLACIYLNTLQINNAVI